MTALSFFNTMTGIGLLVIMAFVVSLWILIFLKETHNRYFAFVHKHALQFGFLLALGATLGSLAYSEIFGYIPCTFCWWQRVFMYPQTVVLALGIAMKDAKVWLTSIILSGIGIIFSLYHVLLQSGRIASSGACEAAGVSCSKIDVLIFGWITIPIMCLVLFGGILTLAYIAHRK